MPGRRLSNEERALLRRWSEDQTWPSLRAIEIDGLRGFSGQRIEFRSPVVAIAGMNGAGKSTVLAVAACGYHQASGGFSYPPLQTSARPYYVFGSFFVGSQQDGYFDGAKFRWEHRGFPAHDLVEATKGSSKWMHYERRPNRSVVYLGMERVLPAVGRRVLRSHFGGKKTISGQQFTPNQMELANRLMNASHTAAERADSAAHHLYGLTTGHGTYTSFHMGAGEEVMCELADLLPRLPEGSLLLIEEAEIGLHPAYQEQLVRVLTEQARARKIQTIMSTHSGYMLELLPREATVFLSRQAGDLQVEYGVGSDLAMSLLSGHPNAELEIYVEDSVAQSLVQEAMPSDVRRRTHISICGSWSAVMGQMAAHRRNANLGPCLAVLDGDVARDDAIAALRKQFEHVDAGLEDWFDRHTIGLPGAGCPECYLWSRLADPGVQTALRAAGGMTPEDLAPTLSGAPPPDWHSLGHVLSEATGLDEKTAMQKAVSAVVVGSNIDFDPLRRHVGSLLDGSA